MNKAISIFTAFLVSLIALASFTLSYSALKEVAENNGYQGWLAYLWPGLIDISMVTFSFAMVSAYLKSEKTFWHWSLIGIYTVLTVSFNMYHAPIGIVPKIVFAVAPISLFFSFHLLMGMLKSSVVKFDLAKDIVKLEKQKVKTQNDIKRIAKPETSNRLKLLKAVSQDSFNVKRYANQEGYTEQTIYYHLRGLISDGKVHKNGDGYQVTSTN